METEFFRDEFAHTVLHNVNIFKDMKKAKKKEKPGILTDEVAESIKNNSYAPKGIDKSTFDSAFSEYVDHVAVSRGKPGNAANSYG